MKMGGEITHMTFVDTAPWSARPSYYFNNMWDFLNDAPSAENATFDPRTGVPTDFRKDTRQTLYALFVQDNYKMRPNLTLTFGLRWERFGSISEKNDNLSSVVLGPGANALTGMSLRLGGTLYEVNTTDFGPQVGGTWSPTRFNDKVVAARRIRHRVQRARPGDLAQRPQQSAVPLRGRQSDRQPDRLWRQQLPGRRATRSRGYASNPATIANFDPNTNLPVPGPNFAPVAVTGFPDEVADDVFVSLFRRT